MMKTTRNFPLFTDGEWCVTKGSYDILDYFGNRDGFPSVRRY